jgi:hypothetical protein
MDSLHKEYWISYESLITKQKLRRQPDFKYFKMANNDKAENLFKKIDEI